MNKAALAQFLLSQGHPEELVKDYIESGTTMDYDVWERRLVDEMLARPITDEAEFWAEIEAFRDA